MRGSAVSWMSRADDVHSGLDDNQHSISVYLFCLCRMERILTEILSLVIQFSQKNFF